MLLVRHVEKLTQHDLIKFDQVAKDVIHKRESIYFHDRLEQLSTQVDQTAEETKSELREEFEQKLENELEQLNTRINKQMTQFLQSKVSQIDKSMADQADKIVKTDAKVKQLDTFLQCELGKLKK